MVKCFKGTVISHNPSHLICHIGKIYKSYCRINYQLDNNFQDVCMFRDKDISSKQVLDQQS